ncbi:autotransporter outer membrane beta-barrel domain-containing protein [Aminobacter sp. UC22_36]|uniref:autotransporter outer membrane beta-barrel domain-containing protein n=1 Tax=Aminobacter sp. UC22_36 TaxID=3374549 RepID=UPI003757360A
MPPNSAARPAVCLSVVTPPSVRIGGPAWLPATARPALTSMRATRRATATITTSASMAVAAGGRSVSGAGAGYSLHSVSTTRTVAFDGFAERLTADYNTGTAQLFGEAGYRLDTAVANFEPFAGLAHVSVRHDAFAEQGGAAALHSVATTNDVTFATLGLRAAAAAHVGGIEATARGMIGWRHAFGDVTPYSALALAGGNAFTIGGTPIARDTLALEAGLDVAVSPNTKFGLGYNGQIASNARDHAVKADLTVKF